MFHGTIRKWADIFGRFCYCCFVYLFLPLFEDVSWKLGKTWVGCGLFTLVSAGGGG